MRAAGAAVALRRPLAAIAPAPHVRGRLLAGLGAFLLLVCVYLFLLRDLGFVRVERVSITGLTSSDAPRIRQELAAAARTMTTLHVRHDRLNGVVASYPAVERLEVHADFPNTLRIEVIEFQPAAMLVSGRSRMAVAGDGRLLRGLRRDTAVPVIRLRGALPAERLGPGAALRAARVAGTAPIPLRRRLVTVTETRERGLVARLRRGPDLIFGDVSRLHAKWLAAARVLADRASRGASYVDLRLPERPAAGGLPVEPAQQAPAVGPATPAPATSPQAPPAATSPQAPPVGTTPRVPSAATPQVPPDTTSPAGPAEGPAAAPRNP